jgi:hypothetical protein
LKELCALLATLRFSRDEYRYNRRHQPKRAAGAPEMINDGIDRAPPKLKNGSETRPNGSEFWCFGSGSAQLGSANVHTDRR